MVRYTKEGQEDGDDSDGSSDDDSDDGARPRRQSAAPSRCGVGLRSHSLRLAWQVLVEREARWEKVTCPTTELLSQLEGMIALESPANQVRLPLSADEVEHLRQLSREARDRCEAAAELPDFVQMLSGMQHGR